MPTPIEKVPNIGPSLAAHLRAVGVETLIGLVEVGDHEAYQRIIAQFPEDATAQTRLELAGAVRSVRWSTLPIALRRELSASTLENRRKPI